MRDRITGTSPFPPTAAGSRRPTTPATRPEPWSLTAGMARSPGSCRVSPTTPTILRHTCRCPPAGRAGWRRSTTVATPSRCPASPGMIRYGEEFVSWTGTGKVRRFIPGRKPTDLVRSPAIQVFSAKSRARRDPRPYTCASAGSHSRATVASSRSTPMMASPCSPADRGNPCSTRAGGSVRSTRRRHA